MRVARVGGEFIVNPTFAQSEEGDLDIIVASTDEAWHVLSYLVTARWLRAAFKFSRSWGLSNVLVIHRPSDLRAAGSASTDRERQRNVAAAIRETADSLGNTAAVARSAYVHPAVVDAYLDGRIRTALVEAAEETDDPPGMTSPDEERAVMSLLRARLREDAGRSASAAR